MNIEQKSKQKIRLKCILNLTFSSIATQQKCYDSVDLLISDKNDIITRVSRTHSSDYIIFIRNEKTKLHTNYI